MKNEILPHRSSSPTGEQKSETPTQADACSVLRSCSPVIRSKTLKERVLAVWNFLWRGKVEVVVSGSSVPLINRLCYWGGSFDAVQTKRLYNGLNFRDESRVTVQRNKSVFNLLTKNVGRLVFK